MECIIISVHYDDFLSLTLPINKSHFDRVIVVTTPDDKATKAVCAGHGVEFAETDAFYENGARFNKGKGINKGLSLLPCKDWIVLLDADIVLPIEFRRRLDSERLRQDCMYTCDRYTCDTYDLWRGINAQEKQRFYKTLFDARIFLYLSKWDQITRKLNIPVGYLQIAHEGSAWAQGYPETSSDANWSDVEFAQRYAHEKRIWLENMSVIHLGKPGISKVGRDKKHRPWWSEPH